MNHSNNLRISTTLIAFDQRHHLIRSIQVNGHAVT